MPSSEIYGTTHESIPLTVTTNKRWWQFWKPKQFTVYVNATVNRDLGVALYATHSNF
ncbi:hypothetical protein K08M3_49580 [Vibrio alginolyticus]|uniref:Uncharacterized protein n=1 Tax=Vibrio alginolyticus TaxID=663 RepID=A0A1W6UFD4_VIBAL|nr:hypothetical protein K04M1_49450 [Vibrio alginolyticus]WKV20252.1 hypothetical protein [Vibrio parahaemolyticus]ARP11573.1 hypothetical protein K04M3_50040 [Vibrio alginolyticus]ARP16654.1 hypothetical protein K04M5_50020 [Vibrio alginolyticus]ARP21673.1 hypothetical protein K05K4_49640 [Vibrio alginolyticus]